MRSSQQVYAIACRSRINLRFGRRNVQRALCSVGVTIVYYYFFRTETQALIELPILIKRGAGTFFRRAPPFCVARSFYKIFGIP